MGLSAQVNVTTLFELNASGGLTTDSKGHLYIGDFGSRLGLPDTTHVYRWIPGNANYTIFKSGFLGASGACFDDLGNFYQSNPHGNQISKVTPNGEVTYDWCQSGLMSPIGLEADRMGNIFVANCSLNEIGKIDSLGNYEMFTSSELLGCPNGLTQDNEGNLYVCNFSDGRILKITSEGDVTVLVELPVLTGGPSQVGNGHLVFSNGWLFVATIGSGEIFRIGLDGSSLKVTGKAFAFSNVDGGVDKATFNKPNGIAASKTGDTLYVNVSKPTWISDPQGLHPACIRMITGVCSLPASGCPVK